MFHSVVQTLGVSFQVSANAPSIEAPLSAVCRSHGAHSIAIIPLAECPTYPGTAAHGLRPVHSRKAEASPVPVSKQPCPGCAFPDYRTASCAWLSGPSLGTPAGLPDTGALASQ